MRGSALIFTLSVLVILFLLGFAFLTSSGGDYLFAGRERARLQAYFLAQSGLIYASTEMEYVNIDQLDGISKELSSGSFRLKVKSSDPPVIESVGTAGATHETIWAELDDEGIVVKWHQQ